MMAATSCASDADTSDTGAAESNTEAADTAVSESAEASDTEAYEFPDIDLGGGDFTVANSETGTWGHYFHIDFEEATGEVLDDAVYARNRKLEEDYNLKLKVHEENIDKLFETLNTAIMSGEDLCDVAYIRSNKLSTMITSGGLYDLASIDGMNLNEEWWDQAVVENSRIGEDGTLFFASNYFSLMSFDGTVCTYINETMLNNLGMDKPYDLVRSGSWTLDALYEYTAAGKNLNGDESFAWDADGSSVYGLATWSNGVFALMRGCDAIFTQIDADGVPVITAGNEHFLNVCEKLASGLCAKNDEFINVNEAAPSPKNYEEIFKNGRALMVVAQIKTSSKYRALDDTFGMLPLPKYDENQENYVSFMPESCTMMCMPMTNGNPEQTAALIDAFSYVSYRDVLPVYYEVNVSQKGLRNEESIEMLDLIRQTRVCEIGSVFGWTTTMQNNVMLAVAAGNGSVASTVESSRSASEAAIEATLGMLIG